LPAFFLYLALDYDSLEISWRFSNHTPSSQLQSHLLFFE
jgi:hypothetical protein